MIEQHTGVDFSQPSEIPKMGGVFEFLVQEYQQELKPQLQDCDQYSRHFDVAKKVSEAHGNVIFELADRSRDSATQLIVRFEEISSSATVSAAYLKMREELGGTMSDKEFVEFFKSCVEINNQTSAKFATLTHDEANRTALMALNRGRMLHLYEHNEKNYKNPPLWFVGDKTSWSQFLFKHSELSSYINQEYILQLKAGATLTKNERTNKLWLGRTFEDQYPDWYYELGDRMPAVEIVEKELEDDRNEYSLLRSLESHFIVQEENIDMVYQKKWAKSANYFERWRRKLEAKNTNLFNAMLYLDTNKNTFEYKTLALGDDEESIDALLNSIVEPGKSQRGIANKFIEDRGFNSEIVTLWLSDSLVDAKKSLTQESLSEIFSWFEQEHTEEELYGLKQKDKNLHNLIKYQLTPFLSVLSSEEKEYIFELTKTRQSAFKTLFDLSELFSQYLRNGMLSQNSKIEEAVKKTAQKMLSKSNDPSLKGILRNAAGSIQEETLDPEISNQVSRETESMEKEVEEKKNTLESTNLVNWNTYWVRDYNRDRKSDLISGENLDEITDDLDTLFQNNGEAFSIKTKSIINALDWFLRVPESVKMLWMKEEIDGVEYYKIKRGPVRIFCTIDKETKSISFFPYQKKAMSYAFRA